MSNLKSVREAQNMTVAALADKAMVKSATIEGIEAGTERASFSTSLKLARALGVDVKSIQEFSSLFGSGSGSGADPLLGPRVGP